MGNEASHVQTPEAEGRQPVPSHAVVVLKWPHGARSASVCGTFNDWKQTPMLLAAEDPSMWIKELELKPGVHQYKFIIDGQWKHDPAAPTVLDALGNINNYATVKLAGRPKAGGAQPVAAAAPSVKPVAKASGADGEKPGSHSASSSAEALRRVNSDPFAVAEVRSVRFSQLVPPKEDLIVQHAASMMLPPQLLLNLPHLAGDGAKPPVHVQLQHLFVHGRAVGAEGDGAGEVAVYSMCTRYRDAFVTSVLYKPSPSSSRARRAFAADRQQLQQTPQPLGFPDVRREGSAARRAIRFLAVRIPECSTRRDEKAGRVYVSYEVETLISVRGAQMTLRSSRRYTHFRLLDQMLRREFGSRGVYTAGRLLPPKRTFGNLDAAFVAERRLALEAFLEGCLELEPVCSSAAFCHFIDTQAHGEDEAGSISRTDSNVLLERISTKQGYLLKQSSRRVAWKSRYFCLYDTELLCYYSEAVANPFQPLNIVHVEGASVRRVWLAALPRFFLFAVRTSQQEWWVAADCEATRESWLLALCNAGATMCAVQPELADGGSVVGGSFSDAAELATGGSNCSSHCCGLDQGGLPGCGARGGGALGSFSALQLRASPSAASGCASGSASALLGGGGCGYGAGGCCSASALGLAAGQAQGCAASTSGLSFSSALGVCAGGGGAAGPALGLRGRLLKRPSKVHILHDLELEPPWVSRHFALLPAERLLVYRDLQPSPEREGPLGGLEPQGILPLGNFGSVEEISVPHSQGLHAFRLCPPAHRSSGGRNGEESPAVSKSASYVDDADSRQPAATDCFVLLAETAEKRREWVTQLSALLRH